MKYQRLRVLRPPVLEVDLRPVFGRYRAHLMPPYIRVGRRARLLRISSRHDRCDSTAGLFLHGEWATSRSRFALRLPLLLVEDDLHGLMNWTVAGDGATRG